MVGVEEGREFRFRGDLYSQESTFLLVFFLFFSFCFFFYVALVANKVIYNSHEQFPKFPAQNKFQAETYSLTRRSKFVGIVDILT